MCAARALHRMGLLAMVTDVIEKICCTLFEDSVRSGRRCTRLLLWEGGFLAPKCENLRSEKNLDGIPLRLEYIKVAGFLQQDVILDYLSAAGEVTVASFL